MYLTLISLKLQLDHLLVKVVKFEIGLELFENLLADLAYAHQFKNRMLSVLFAANQSVVCCFHLTLESFEEVDPPWQKHNLMFFVLPPPSGKYLTHRV